MNTSLLIRKFYSEALLLDMECTKLIVYFAIIYSSQVDLIHNPHLRSEIFDILLYFFISNPQERNSKQNTQLLKILNDEFVKENLIYSLMRVFIDAERLGTSNQFYEKFSIRNKILYLIENLMKTHKSIYSDKFLDFANKFRFDTIKMINLLMNDLTFLIDECIERLMQIKKFQDLRADVERYNALDEETKQLETDKFNDNDQRVRTELKVNSSMNFMVIICQFCQDNFMSLKLSERLANLLNYSLDVFTSKKNLKLKVKFCLKQRSIT
jgi:ubiquitin conjugation factor E4 B